MKTNSDKNTCSKSGEPQKESVTRLTIYLTSTQSSMLGMLSAFRRRPPKDVIKQLIESEYAHIEGLRLLSKYREKYPDIDEETYQPLSTKSESPAR